MNRDPYCGKLKGGFQDKEAECGGKLVIYTPQKKQTGERRRSITTRMPLHVGLKGNVLKSQTCPHVYQR